MFCMKVLIIVLIGILIVLLAVVVWSIVTIVKRFKEGRSFDKLSTIATILTSLGSLVVGIATVYVMFQQENRERSQHQPLYRVVISLNDLSKDGIFDNEEYQVFNEGGKTKVKTEVKCYSFLELSYYNVNSHDGMITKLCPIKDYFNWGLPTGNLDGKIVFTAYSGDNLDHFSDIYIEAMDYSKTHPGESVFVAMNHYFDIHYVDIYGEQHRIVKNDDYDMDPNRFDELRKEAFAESGEIEYDISKITLDSLLNTFFHAELMKNDASLYESDC